MSFIGNIVSLPYVKVNGKVFIAFYEVIYACGTFDKTSYLFGTISDQFLNFKDYCFVGQLSLPIFLSIIVEFFIYINTYSCVRLLHILLLSGDVFR
jgi:membrane protein insertase Oxa1/YidC/SpoIIIJ